MEGDVGVAWSLHAGARLGQKPVMEVDVVR